MRRINEVWERYWEIGHFFFWPCRASALFKSSSQNCGTPWELKMKSRRVAYSGILPGGFLREPAAAYIQHHIFKSHPLRSESVHLRATPSPCHQSLDALLRPSYGILFPSRRIGLRTDGCFAGEVLIYLSHYDSYRRAPTKIVFH